MRNSADFAKHLQNRRTADEFGIHDFLRGVNLRSTGAVQNALSVGTDASGGYTVPSVLMPGVLSALVPASVC